MGVVVRRYIDVLILLIPTPLVSVLFCSSIPTFCSLKKIFFILVAIIMYSQRLYLLFTCKQNCLHYFFRGTYLQRISVFMQNFKFDGVTILAVQLFNKI